MTQSGPVAAGSAAQAQAGTGTVQGAPADAEPALRMESIPPAFPLLERGWWIQFGAFGTLQNADAARERLKSQMHQALGAPLDVYPDAPLFRVQAGPWPTREAATSAAERARAAGFEGTPYVVQR